MRLMPARDIWSMSSNSSKQIIQWVVLLPGRYWTPRTTMQAVGTLRNSNCAQTKIRFVAAKKSKIYLFVHVLAATLT